MALNACTPSCVCYSPLARGNTSVFIWQKEILTKRRRPQKANFWVEGEIEIFATHATWPGLFLARHELPSRVRVLLPDAQG